MRMQQKLVPILFAAMLAGCASITIGRDFDLRTFQSKVERGATTQAQVREWLGAPNGGGASVQPNGERYEEWLYYFGSAGVPGKGARLKTLQLKFDASGVVRAYNWADGQ